MEFRARLFRPSLGQAVRAIVVAVVAGFWVYALVRGIADTLYSPLSRGDGLPRLLITIAVHFIGTGLPTLLVIWLFLRLREHRQQGNRGAIYSILRVVLAGDAGIVALYLLFYCPIFIFIDKLLLLSASPLTVPAGGLLTACVGFGLIRRSQMTGRIVALAVLVGIAMSAGYQQRDAGALLHDAQHVHIGMAAQEVETIMASHKIGPAGPIENEPDAEDLVYMTPRSCDIVSVRLKDGKVESAAFSSD